MGNASGKLNGAMSCDGGGVVPNGIYPESAQDYDGKIVQRLIFARQLAPFYEGADDADPAGDEASEGADSTPGSQCRGDDGWWSYNLMLAQRQQEQQQQQQQSPTQHSRQQSEVSLGSTDVGRRVGHARKGSGLLQRLRVAQLHAGTGETHSPTAAEHTARHERSLSDMSQAVGSGGTLTADACRRLLRRHIECPICFLYYPQNINYTRCCHKPICTECFVQIKRKLEEDRVEPTHCPYCVAPNLGIVYHALPTAAASALAEGARQPITPKSLGESGRARSQSSASSTNTAGHLVPLGVDPAVVMSDDIRPARVRELNAQLEARRRKQMRSAENMAVVAAATRMASARDARRLSTAGSPSRFGGRSRRGSASSRPHHPPHEYVGYVDAMRAAGHTDLEEFMFQEAVRQSLAEQERQQTVTAAGASAASSVISPAIPPDPRIDDHRTDSALASPAENHPRPQLSVIQANLRGNPEYDDDNTLPVPESDHAQSDRGQSDPAQSGRALSQIDLESAAATESPITASEGVRPPESHAVLESVAGPELEFSAFGTSDTLDVQTVSAAVGPAAVGAAASVATFVPEATPSVGNNRTQSPMIAASEDRNPVRSVTPRRQSRSSESVAQPTAPRSDDVLTLAPFELDAIASVSSRRHRRPAPPVPTRRDDVRGHRHTFSSPMPGDLMSFVDTPPVLSSNNPFLATIAQQPPLPPRSAAAAASGTPEPRRRRPAPPPPPIMQNSPTSAARLRSASHGAPPGSSSPASGTNNDNPTSRNAPSQSSTTLII
ncbi:SNF1-interacting protein [Coemansia sp. RSA 988]|nr:SNF1-interacting protein [Coemansia sp. RSA 988]